jgi:hypothetical protein
MPAKRRSPILVGAGKEVPVHWMHGWEWVWMTFVMVFWVVVLGAIVYAAVRLANRPPRADS